MFRGIKDNGIDLADERLSSERVTLGTVSLVVTGLSYNHSGIIEIDTTPGQTVCVCVCVPMVGGITGGWRPPVSTFTRLQSRVSQADYTRASANLTV